MKKIIASVAIASMLASNIAMAAYADDVTLSEETVADETLTGEQTDKVSENISEDMNVKESDGVLKDSGDTVSEGEISDEAAAEADSDVSDENKENEDSENPGTSDDNTEIENTDADEKEPSSEKNGDGKDTQREQRLEDKAEKLEAINKLREMKLLAKAAKIESLTYLKEVRTLFKDVDKADRQEVLEELAAIKEELKDYSVDAFVNGICIDFEKYDNVKPVIENGRTLAPIRAVAESLGAEVTWNEETQSITITDNGIKIEMSIGNTAAYVNGAEVTLDAAPEIRNDRTLVPVRFIAEAFGLDVAWDETSNSIIIE